MSYTMLSIYSCESYEVLSVYIHTKFCSYHLYVVSFFLRDNERCILKKLRIPPSRKEFNIQSATLASQKMKIYSKIKKGCHSFMRHASALNNFAVDIHVCRLRGMLNYPRSLSPLFLFSLFPVTGMSTTRQMSP